MTETQALKLRAPVFKGLPSGFANDTGYVSASGLYYKDHALPVRCLKD